MQQSVEVSYVLTLYFILSLATLTFTPDKDLVMWFFWTNLLEEVIGFVAASQGRTFKDTFTQYSKEIWTYFDILRLIMQLMYWDDTFSCGNEAVIFKYLTLISWMCFLKYLRINRTLSLFIHIGIECIKQAVSFMTVLLIMFLSFGLSQYANQRWDTPETIQEEFYTVFMPIMKAQYRNMYGAFDPKLNDYNWLFFFLSSFIVTLLMMTLLVSIMMGKF
jgi:hypothetical protein